MPTSPARNPRISEDGKGIPLHMIILAILLSVFFLILIISLICFLRATGRLGGRKSRRTDRDGKLPLSPNYSILAAFMTWLCWKYSSLAESRNLPG